MFGLNFTAHAQAPQTEAWTANCTTTIGGVGDVATLQGLECVFGNILRVTIPLLGIAAFIILISGGIQYMTSAGDPKQTQKARGTITAAIIGLVVVLGIWFLFQILNAFTGLDLLNFKIPG